MAVQAPSLRDAYSFVIAVATEDQKSLAATFSAARKTANSWKAVDLQLSAAGPNNSILTAPRRAACLKPLVRRGIPYEHRPTQWHLLSGAAAKQAAAGAGTYARLCADAPASLPKATLVSISTDLGPSCFAFRGHPTFRAPEGLDGLQRLLGALLLRNPGAYFKGLAHVAGFVLIVMGPASEEAAFWVLATLLEDKLFAYCKGEASYGLKVEAAVVEALVAKKLPNLAAHLERIGTSASALVAPWLSGLFTTTLPSEVTARLMDALLLEGNKVLLRVCLALLKTYEGTITAAGNPAQLRNVLDARAGRMYDGDALMSAAFKGVGPMGGAMIGALRASAIAAVDAHMAQHAACLEAILCRTH